MTKSQKLDKSKRMFESTAGGLGRVAVILAASMIIIPNLFAQTPQTMQDAKQSAQQAQYQAQLQQVINEKAAYATGIVTRWEDAARAVGRWDQNYETDLYNALMKLAPDNLLAAGQASSFQGMMKVLATGNQAPSISPNSLGDSADDMVYTPVTPCRIVDTRNAGGIITANSTRAFDMDGTSFATQGGYNGSCGIPFGVAYAVAMTVTSTGSDGTGYFTAWQWGASQPFSSVLNFAAGQNIANTSIVPTVPGSGPDFYIYAGGADSHAVIDVVGYFAAPVATALDCTTVASAFVAVAVNSWTAIDAGCPTGRTVTGGGWFTSEGTLGYPGVWVLSVPNGSNGWRTWVDNQTNGPRNIQTWANCCRVPGR